MRHRANDLCPVCRREPRFHGWFDANLALGNPARDASYRELCSRACQIIFHGRRGMIDPTPNERASMQHAGRMGGEYLDSIGQTDLASLSDEEWRTFVECVVTGFCDSLREFAARDEARIQQMREGAPF